MTRSASAFVFGSEFDDFLFAPIGEDRNGMLLSVLSALARLDVDPWQEAAELARLPGHVATQRMASLIAALPDWPSTQPDPGTIAARLVALLPRRDRFNNPSHKALPLASAATNSRTVVFVIFMVVVLGAQYFLVSRQSAAPVDDAHAPATSRVLQQQTPPLNPGR
jgi:hypothetical protein